MKRYLLAIDPGNIQSGYAILDEDDYRPMAFGKIDNVDLLRKMSSDDNRLTMIVDDYIIKDCVIEMVACYGMPVGAEVFDTCVWIGRYKQVAEEYFLFTPYIYRKEEKLNLCNTSTAKDSHIRQALADRFARGQGNYGKGTKKAPGWFYGFKTDIWAAYAVGVTYLDIKKGMEKR